MNQVARKEEYLAKAKEADLEAARAATPDGRDGWLKVAQGYRGLAAGTGEIFKL
ncbi:MAG TPA: hypothetical protein VNX61_11930 [Rhizomicrobium sp.]|jgi:hypothetical protein|nr:hypothetical protein [Rhizomicrobium sp.]